MLNWWHRFRISMIKRHFMRQKTSWTVFHFGWRSKPLCISTRIPMNLFTISSCSQTALLGGSVHCWSRYTFRSSSISTMRPIRSLKFISWQKAMLALCCRSNKTSFISKLRRVTILERLILWWRLEARCWVWRKWWSLSTPLTLTW